MNKKIIYFFLLISILLFLNYFLKPFCRNKQAIIYKLQNKNYCLLVADSSVEWTKGLMFYKKPVNFDGMIFIFPEKDQRTFWNLNTYLNLDIYWLDDQKIVGKSYLPSIEKENKIIRVSSNQPIDKVIELIK